MVEEPLDAAHARAHVQQRLGRALALVVANPLARQRPRVAARVALAQSAFFTQHGTRVAAAVESANIVQVRVAAAATALCEFAAVGVADGFERFRLLRRHDVSQSMSIIMYKGGAADDGPPNPAHRIAASTGARRRRQHPRRRRGPRMHSHQVVGGVIVAPVVPAVVLRRLARRRRPERRLRVVVVDAGSVGPRLRQANPRWRRRRRLSGAILGHEDAAQRRVASELRIIHGPDVVHSEKS